MIIDMNPSRDNIPPPLGTMPLELHEEIAEHLSKQDIATLSALSLAMHITYSRLLFKVCDCIPIFNGIKGERVTCWHTYRTYGNLIEKNS